MTITLLHGDCREMLRTLEPESIQTVVTSPPYYQLRRYSDDPREIGQETTPALYVAALVEVFRQVHRVLRKDGTLWLNLGDSFVMNGTPGQSNLAELGKQYSGGGHKHDEIAKPARRAPAGLPVKNLMGIPWRVAFALQDDGWILRSDIIWNKPNAMPESTTDRPTRSHEYLFMFSKAQRTGPSPRRFDYISDEDARWLALFLDTEGNISVKRASGNAGRIWYGAQICFASTSQLLLDATQQIIGSCAVLTRKGKNSPMYYLQLSNRKAADLLHRIYPFLIVKQRQARALIYLQDLIADSSQERHSKVGQLRGRTRSDEYTAKLECIWELNKSLNHFGDPDDHWIPEPKYGKWKSARYYYDAAAIAEPLKQSSIDRINQPSFDEQTGGPKDYGATGVASHRSMRKTLENFKSSAISGTRNKRSVWEIATQNYPGGHFATMPEALIEPCILAGSGALVCETCGTAWTRARETTGHINKREPAHVPNNTTTKTDSTGCRCPSRATDRFIPACSCAINTGTGRSIVLDPFGGSGTVAQVSERLQRDSVLVELKADYLDLQKKRTNGVQIEMQV